MSYYHEKESATERYLRKRKDDLERKERYWISVDHFNSRLCERALIAIRAEKDFVCQFITIIEATP
jgi:hypothetical protein